MRPGGDGQPGGVGGELPRGQVRQRPVGPVGEDLLDDGVAAVVLLGLDGLERRVGEDRMVPPYREQAESARAMTVPVQPASRAAVMAWVTRLAAPRDEAAFPPRSLVAAITGAVRPLTSSDLPWIFVCPNRAASAARNSRPAFSSCSTFPQV